MRMKGSIPARGVSCGFSSSPRATGFIATAIGVGVTQLVY
jgi:hypothetical protein